jgi:hypothetical protein
MQQFSSIYQNLFPHTGISDWFFAFLGLLLHAVMKLKTVPLKQFQWRIFLNDFLIVWTIAFLTIIICLGTLPTYLENYSHLDSALIGYSSSSILRQLFKQKLSNLGINDN